MFHFMFYLFKLFSLFFWGNLSKRKKQVKKICFVFSKLLWFNKAINATLWLTFQSYWVVFVPLFSCNLPFLTPMKEKWIIIYIIFFFSDWYELSIFPFDYSHDLPWRENTPELSSWNISIWMINFYDLFPFFCIMQFNITLGCDSFIFDPSKIQEAEFPFFEFVSANI